MVRTKADCAGIRRAVASKAPRKNVGAAAGGMGGPGSATGSRNCSGNAACDRPTPEWQKSIATFFKKDTSSKKETTVECEAPAIEETPAPDTVKSKCADHEGSPGLSAEAESTVNDNASTVSDDSSARTNGSDKPKPVDGTKGRKRVLVIESDEDD